MPTDDGLTKIQSICAENDLQSYNFSKNAVSFQLARSQLASFVAAIRSKLNGLELARAKVLTTDGAKPDLSDLGRTLTGQEFVKRFDNDWVINALDSGIYETWFQPILSCAAASDDPPFAHEGLFRLKDADGKIISPGFLFSVVDQSDLLFTLDLVARRTAVECAAKAGLKSKIFINFNPSSIYDPSYCLKTTASAIEELGIKPSQIVFEVTETHQARDMNHLKQILSFYKDAGFGVALDDIGSGYSGLNMLHELRPDYVKIDMELIHGINGDSYKQVIVNNLLETARSLSLKTVVEGIETEGEAAWVRQAGADYMQGYFFGRPKPMA